MSKLSEAEFLDRLRGIDTPTISNVVATYPRSEDCLKLYDAWYGEWYTDTTIKCMYPDMGPMVGQVVTAVFSESSERYTGVDRWALPKALREARKPTILMAEQQFPQNLENRVGLFGEMMTTQYRALGVVGVATNGPMRDVDAIKPLGVQYYATGVTPAHGDFMVKAVNVPVTIGGLTVMPGDMVHMDLHGIVKFPLEYMERILDLAEKLLEREREAREFFTGPEFSIENWRRREEGRYSG